MDKFTNFIETKLAPPLVRISQIRYLQAIQRVFMTTMPVLIFSSFLILAVALPIPGWDKIVADFSGKLWMGVNSTLGLLSLLVAILCGYHLGAYYQEKGEKALPINTAIVAFLSFMMFNPIFVTTEGQAVVSATFFGSTGIFAAFFISFTSVEIYRFFLNRNFTIKMPAGVPPMVVDAFTSLIPSMVAIGAYWLIAQVAEINILQIINDGFQPLVTAGKGPIPQFFSFFLDRLLWFTGIHGSNVVQSVMKPVWIQMFTENAEALQQGLAIPNLLTEEWCNYFVRISVLPICVLAATSKVKRYKTLGKMALPASIFNIAEPMMFGLPLILNPILFVPWVFGWSLLWIWTYIFTAIIPILPPVITQVAWTVPCPISAYLATGGSWVAGLFSLGNYFIIGLIFFPFFKVLEKQAIKEENLIKEEAIN